MLDTVAVSKKSVGDSDGEPLSEKEEDSRVDEEDDSEALADGELDEAGDREVLPELEDERLREGEEEGDKEKAAGAVGNGVLEAVGERRGDKLEVVQ